MFVGNSACLYMKVETVSHVSFVRTAAVEQCVLVLVSVFVVDSPVS